MISHAPARQRIVAQHNLPDRRGYRNLALAPKPPDAGEEAAIVRIKVARAFTVRLSGRALKGRESNVRLLAGHLPDYVARRR